MYKICKTEQSFKRQRLIEDILIQMMQKEHFSNIKISELCLKAEIPRKAFYRYFDTKEDVLYAIVDHALLDFVDYCNLKVKNEMLTNVKIMEDYYRFWKGKSSLIKALENSNSCSLLVERTVYLENNGIGNFPSRESNNNFDAHNVFSYTGLFSLMIAWLRTDSKTPEEMAELTVDLLTKPLYSKNK